MTNITDKTLNKETSDETDEFARQRRIAMAEAMFRDCRLVPKDQVDDNQ